MKIYFSTSATNILEDKVHNIHKIEAIINILKTKNHTILKRTLLIGHDKSTPKQREDTSRFFDYIEGTTEDVYNKNIKKIKNTDIAIFESTYPAEGIGYEIGFAITQRKPVLILIDKTYKTFLAEMIEGIPSSLKQLSYYEKKEELKNIIAKFINKAKGTIDSKFIMIISPEIDRYFEWAKHYKRLHKAQIVRDAIYKQMEEDENWKS